MRRARADDLVPLLVRQMSKPAPAIDLLAVVVHETLQAAFEKPDLGLALDQETAGDQPLSPPAIDRSGRDIVTSADFLDGQHRLGDVLDGLADRRRQVAEEESQIVPYVLTGQHQQRRRVGPVAGDPEAEKFKGITSIRVDLAEQALGAVEQLQPPLPASNARLLVLQLFEGRMAVHAGAHRRGPPDRTHSGQETMFLLSGQSKTPVSPDRRPE